MLPSIAKISAVAPGITRILGMNPSPMTLQGTNSYVIGSEDSNKRLLIDTSSPENPSYIDNIRHYFLNVCQNKPKITDVIITHWHADHLGSVPDILNFAKSQNWPLPKIHKFPSVSNPDCLPCRYEQLDMDQNFDLYDFGLSGDLRTMYTPGHTDDHICLFMVPDNILFTGDLILGHGSTVFEDLILYMESLRRVESMGSHLNLLLPAHGLEIVHPMDKIEEYIEHRNVRIQQVYNALSKFDWRCENELLIKVYPSEVLQEAKLFFGALSNQFEALKYLQNSGRAESRDLTESEKLDPDNYMDTSLSGKLWRGR